MRKIYYYIKGKLKVVRWHGRRVSVGIQNSFKDLNAAPIVLGNAIPKSGSHLIIQILRGLTKMGPFINPGFPPVNRAEDNRKLQPVAIMKNLQRMRSGDIGYSYLGSSSPYVDLLTTEKWATIFVYRDPRDMVVSAVKYATDMNLEHGMHEYFSKRLKTDEERINVVIQGKQDEPGLEYSDIRTRYENYLGWLEQPAVLCLRFEDLILNRDETLGQILDYLSTRGFTPKVSRSEAISVLKQSIEPKKSGTFRKGQPGGWKEIFTTDNIKNFKQVTGDLLVRLGYEKDNNW